MTSDHPISSCLPPPVVIYLFGLSQGVYKQEEEVRKKYEANYEKKAIVQMLQIITNTVIDLVKKEVKSFFYLKERVSSLEKI